jgi:hypothetical protein
MAENFTAKQKEVIARKMGYDGPMQGFDMFLKSSPALASKFNSVTDKYVAKMAKGGLVKKYAEGGTVTYSDTGVPIAGAPAQVTAAQITPTADQFLGTETGAPTAATQAAISTAGPAEAATTTQAAPSATVTTTTAAPASPT